jgi:hypothetical protein
VCPEDEGRIWSYNKLSDRSVLNFEFLVFNSKFKTQNQELIIQTA